MAIERPLEKKTCDEIERKMQAGYQAFQKNSHPQSSTQNLTETENSDPESLRNKRATEYNTDIRLEFHEKYSTKISLHVLNDRYFLYLA